MIVSIFCDSWSNRNSEIAALNSENYWKKKVILKSKLFFNFFFDKRRQQLARIHLWTIYYLSLKVFTKENVFFQQKNAYLARKWGKFSFLSQKWALFYLKAWHFFQNLYWNCSSILLRWLCQFFVIAGQTEIQKLPPKIVKVIEKKSYSKK